MSLVISSTTDTQEDVNAAAGIETDAGEAETPTDATTPAPKPAEKPAEEPEEDGDEENGEESEQPQEDKPRRKGGFQRKIEALERERERERWYAQKQIEELQSMLAAQRRPAGETPQPAPSPSARPTLDQFQDYDQYVEAVADWKTEQKIAERERELARQAREWHAQEQQRQLMGGWQQRISEFRSKAEDFDDALAAVEHIEIPPEIQRALIEYDNGPQLAYALAKEPKELQRIARIESPRAALRELGKFEAKLSAQAETPKRAAPVSRAPEPIKPVGQGAATSTKSVDEMSYQEYKAYREREIAAKKRRAA